MTTPDTVISAAPPSDGREWECQCARCGSSVHHEPCGDCDPFGEVEDVEDDAWSTLGGETRSCDACGGAGAFASCLSSPEWCDAHPIPGREATKRVEVEWFTFDARPDAAEGDA